MSAHRKPVAAMVTCPTCGSGNPAVRIAETGFGPDFCDDACDDAWHSPAAPLAPATVREFDEVLAEFRDHVSTGSNIIGDKLERWLRNEYARLASRPGGAA